MWENDLLPASSKLDMYFKETKRYVMSRRYQGVPKNQYYKENTSIRCVLFYKIGGKRMGSYVAGFKRIYVGVFDNKAEKVTELYTWEDDKGGTVRMNITGLAPDKVDMFASNKRVWIKNKVQTKLNLI